MPNEVCSSERKRPTASSRRRIEKKRNKTRYKNRPLAIWINWRSDSTGSMIHPVSNVDTTLVQTNLLLSSDLTRLFFFPLRPLHLFNTPPSIIFSSILIPVLLRDKTAAEEDDLNGNPSFSFHLYRVSSPCVSIGNVFSYSSFSFYISLWKIPWIHGNNLFLGGWTGKFQVLFFPIF